MTYASRQASHLFLEVQVSFSDLFSVFSLFEHIFLGHIVSSFNVFVIAEEVIEALLESALARRLGSKGNAYALLGLLLIHTAAVERLTCIALSVWGCIHILLIH